VTEKKSHIFLDSWDLSSVPPRRASAFVTGVSWGLLRASSQREAAELLL
jgi:hypothetical protein